MNASPARHPANPSLDPGRVPTALPDGAAEPTSRWSRLVAVLLAAAERLPGRAGQWPMLWVVLLLGGAVMAAATEAAGRVYEAVEENDGLAALDRPILDAMIGLRSGPLDGAITAFTTVGGPIVAPIVATLVVLALAWRWRSWLPIVLMVAASAGSLAMTVVGKRFVERVRPAQELAVPPYEFSPSFPSGHSLNAVVVGGVIAYLLLRHSRGRGHRRWIVGLAIAYALLMGLSRVYLGHHWLTDVLTGWLLGAAWLAFIVTAHRLLVTVERYRRGEVVWAGAPQAQEERRMTDYVIEPADPEAPECAALLRDYAAEVGTRHLGRAATGEELAEFARTNSSAGMTPPDGDFLVATRGEDILGCVGVRWLDDSTGEIKRMYVAPAGRGLGLGLALLAAAHDAIRASGRSVARLDTRSELTEAVALYEKAGYRQIPRYNGNPYAQAWYELRLT